MIGKFNLNPIASSVFIFFLVISVEHSYANCTLTNYSKAEKEPDGEFSVSVTGSNCNLDTLVGSSQKDGANYGNINYGHIEETKSNAGDYGEMISDVRGNFSQPDDFLIIMSQRPAGYTLAVQAGAVLSYDKNLFIDSSVSDSHGLRINGKADIAGDLVVQSAAGQAERWYNNRVIYMNGGELDVGGKLESLHIQQHRQGKAGAPNIQMENKSIINVEGEAYIYSRTGGRLLHLMSGSKISAGGNMTLFAERLKSSLTGGEANNYSNFALHNEDGHVKAENINVYTQGFNGILQESGATTLETGYLTVDTTLPDPQETAQWSSPQSNALVINGGLGVANAAQLVSTGSAIVVNQNSTAFSLGDSSVSSIADLAAEDEKSLLTLGGLADIQSLNSNAVSIADGVNSDITLQAGVKITAGKVESITGGQVTVEEKNLIADGDGDARLFFQDGVNLRGQISLGAGNDTLEMKGVISGTINMGADDDTVNLYQWNQDAVIDAGAGSNDVLNILGEISAGSVYRDQQQGTQVLNFDEINILNKSVLNLNGQSIDAGQMKILQGGELRIDDGLENSTVNANVLNQGLINLDHLNHQKIQTLTINGDYRGDNAVLQVSTLWNKSEAANGYSEDDLLIINGNASGTTSVVVKDGIAGNIELATNPQESVPVVTVNGSVGADAFYGVAQTTNAGEAQLKFVKKSGAQGGDFVWTLSASNGEEIYSPDIPGYVVAPYVNVEMLRDSIGTYRSRKGGEYNNGYDFKNWGETGIWARAWHKHLKANGTSRLDWKSRSTGYQFGYEIDNAVSEKGSIRSDAYISYVFSHSDAFDQLRAESGALVNNKHAGRMKTNNFNIGWTRTYMYDDQSYKDLVLQASSIKNRYAGNRGTQASNRGFALTASFEQGWHYGFAEKWYLEPMYQFMVGHMSLKDFHDGYRDVSQGGRWDALLRAGGRLYFKDAVENQKNNLVYAKAYVVHDFSPQSKAQIGVSDVREKHAKNWAEIGLGFEVKNGKSTYFFLEGNMDRNLGGAYRNSYSVNFGINHKW